MTLVASRQLSPVRPPAGYATPLPTKLRGPMVTGQTRNELLENSAFMIDRPSETMVPVPTAARPGISCFTSMPKLEPV